MAYANVNKRVDRQLSCSVLVQDYMTGCVYELSCVLCSTRNACHQSETCSNVCFSTISACTEKLSDLLFILWWECK